MSALPEKWQRALERRRPLLLSSATNCLRLFDGEVEGLPGVVVEKWNDVLCLQIFEGRFAGERKLLEELAQFFLQSTHSRTAYLRDFVRNRNQEATGGAVLLYGEPQNEVTVLENGARFLIRPEEKFSVGLFLDQRENRKWLSERVRGKRVLNLFSYTCAFSVHAALQGAQRVDSVDVSKKYLNWGRVNFEQNSLAVKGHGFWEDDVRDFLLRSQKRGLTFDQIVIDPPTFGRGKRGKVFQVMKDSADLLEKAQAVLAPQGEIFFSTNCVDWYPKTFRALMESVFHQGSFKELDLPKAPSDFPDKPSALKNICFKAD